MSLLPIFIERLTPAVLTGIVLTACIILRRLFACPSELRHLPRVPIVPTILSFLAGETEAQRTERLLIPVAKRAAAPIVVLWALGEWYVHVLDHKAAKQLMEDKSISKQSPHEDMLFWKFTGTNNIFFSDGDAWSKHAQTVREVLHRNIPVDIFVALSHKLLSVLSQSDGGHRPWSSLAHRFTLDVVGQAILGYNFEALEQPDGFLVKQYRDIMHDISQPLYIAFPILERWLPRTQLQSRILNLRTEFGHLLAQKLSNPGQDFMSLMLSRQPAMTDIEYLDNVVTMFMAGHDTTAGALSTAVYYLAIHPECQARAREEVTTTLLSSNDADVGQLSYISVSQFQNMPYLNACVRESMRLNGPSVLTIPRLSRYPVVLGHYVIPPNIPITLNLYAVLHDENVFGDTTSDFLPERWLQVPTRADNRQSTLDAAWIPFSTGSRRCPAMNFALYELRTVLSLLLLKFDWTLPQDSIHRNGLKNQLSTFALNLPEDLHITFHKLR